MKFARTINNVVVEVVEWDPAGRYPADWTWWECPAETRQGSTVEGGLWTHPVLPPQSPAYRTRMTVPDFMALMTMQERIAVRQARAYSGSDTALQAKGTGADDFLRIVDDTRVQTIDTAIAPISGCLDFLAASGLLAQERIAVIRRGVLL